LFLQFILALAIWRRSDAYYGDYTFEPWVQGVGYCMTILPIAAIVVVAIIKIWQLGVCGGEGMCVGKGCVGRGHT
jgi:hypothetical protein